MFKKILASILGLTLLFSMTACSKNKTEDVVDVVKLNETIFNSDGYFTDIKASDYVKLNKLDSLEVDWIVIEEQIQEQLDYYKPQTTITDRAVVDGDLVKISYIGYFGDASFSGGSQTEIYVEVGKDTDDFIQTNIAEQLVDHMPNDKFDVILTFPDNYDKNPAYAGKEARFAVTVHNILEIGECEWTDEFVKEHFSDYLGISTTEEAEKIMLNDVVFNALYDAAEFSDEIPTKLTDWLFELNVDYLRDIAKNNNITLEEYLLLNNVESLDKLKENSLESYKYQAKIYLFCQALAEYFEYKVTDTDIDNYFNDSSSSTEAVEAAKKQMLDQYGMNYVKAIVMYTYIQDNLTDMVEVKVAMPVDSGDSIEDNNTVTDDVTDTSTSDDTIETSPTDETINEDTTTDSSITNDMTTEDNTNVVGED